MWCAFLQCLCVWLWVRVCVRVCVCLDACWWQGGGPRDDPVTSPGCWIIKGYSDTHMMTAWKEQHRDRAREGVMMGGRLGEFRSGHCLLCGRWETHYFSLLYPTTPCFSCFPCFAFTSSVAISVFPLCGLHSPLSRSVCCQLKLHFFLSMVPIFSSTHKSLSSSLFIYLFFCGHLSLLLLPSNLPTSNNLSCLISLSPATSSFTIFAFFACLNYVYLSPPSLSH